MKRKIINIDEELDMEINKIAKLWCNNGYKNAKKPDVLRVLINKYKEQLEFPTRKPKSKDWFL